MLTTTDSWCQTLNALPLAAPPAGLTLPHLRSSYGSWTSMPRQPTLIPTLHHLPQPKRKRSNDPLSQLLVPVKNGHISPSVGRSTRRLHIWQDGTSFISCLSAAMRPYGRTSHTYFRLPVFQRWNRSPSEHKDTGRPSGEHHGSPSSPATHETRSGRTCKGLCRSFERTGWWM